MEEVVTVGLDIAKSVFQVHGVDAEGRVVVQRKLTRAKLIPFFEKLSPCRVGIEACATAHHWGRKLGELGHEVKLMPPSYVKPYLKRQKNDAADAEAICEAVSRPSMRFVEVKSPEQQSVLVIHRTRMTLMRHRIELSNTIRAHMAEFGLAAPIGRLGLQGLVEIIRDDADEASFMVVKTDDVPADHLELRCGKSPQEIHRSREDPMVMTIARGVMASGGEHRMV